MGEVMQDTRYDSKNPKAPGRTWARLCPSWKHPQSRHRHPFTGISHLSHCSGWWKQLREFFLFRIFLFFPPSASQSHFPTPPSDPGFAAFHSLLPTLTKIQT